MLRVKKEAAAQNNHNFKNPNLKKKKHLEKKCNKTVFIIASEIVTVSCVCKHHLFYKRTQKVSEKVVPKPGISLHFSCKYIYSYAILKGGWFICTHFTSFLNIFFNKCCNRYRYRLFEAAHLSKLPILVEYSI